MWVLQDKAEIMKCFLFFCGVFLANNLTEAEEIRKRWQEYPEGLYKTGLDDLDNHDGVATHLEK